MAGPASAHTIQQRRGIAGPLTSVSGQVTILVLDMSLSMESNDAPQIRCSAAKAYIDLSDQEDKIGIIGLTNTDGTTDKEGFVTASDWQEPLPVSVESQRQALKEVITQRPPGTPSCEHPFGSTPLYDALAKAFDMLSRATHTPQGNLRGSVVLLSDGEPDSNPNTQMSQVRSELIPKFLKNKWPIETIALDGHDDYLTFLDNLAHQTGGSFYDDTQGHISGVVSPLNITDFFITILAKRHNLTIPTHTPVQTLGDTPLSQDIRPPEYTSHLDVVVAKEQSINVTLTTPEGRTLSVSPAGEDITIIDDSYYKIFSINAPRPATYQLTISGSGQFLIYNLATSYLKISITSPADISVLPLDKPLTLTAQVVDSSTGQDEPITGTRFSLKGTLRYEENAEKRSRTNIPPRDLSDTGSPGIYRTTFPLPADAPPGLYSISVSVAGDTNAGIANESINIRLVHPPTILFSAQSGSQSGNPLQIQQIQWQPLFQTIYNPGFPITRWLSLPALQQHSLYPEVSLEATIQVDKNSLSHLAITDVVISPLRGSAQHIHVTKDHGHFRFKLPRLTDGVYTLAFTLGGTFENGSVQLGSTSYIFHLVNVPPPLDWLWPALLVTGLYTLLLLLCLIAYWYLTGPSPFGTALLVKDNTHTYHYPFNKVRRNPLTILAGRHTIYSEQVPLADQQDADGYWKYLPGGLVIRFSRHGKIKVRRRRWHKQAPYWKSKAEDQDKNFFKFREASNLIYQPVNEKGIASQPWEYTIDPSKTKKQ